MVILVFHKFASGLDLGAFCASFRTFLASNPVNANERYAISEQELIIEMRNPNVT